MRQEKAITIGDRTVVVYELTIAEIRNMLREAEQGAEGAALVSDLGQVLFEDVTFADLALMSDMDEAGFDGWAPSEIRQLADAWPAKRLTRVFLRWPIG